MAADSALTTRSVVAPEATQPRRRTVVALGVWGALVVGSSLLVLRLRWAGIDVKLDAPPLHGSVQPRVTAFLAGAGLVGAAMVWWLPAATRRLGWGALLATSFAMAAGFAVVLAFVHHGPGGLTEPLTGRYEYLGQVGAVGSPGAFLAGFADGVRARAFSVHVHGHPPGFLLALWAMDRVGLGGTVPAAASVIAGGAAAVPCVLVAVRNVVSEDAARRAAPFLVIAPPAIWVATSADALFAGVAAAAATAVIVASGRPGRHGDRLALGGGIGFGVAAFLSYGLVLAAVIPCVVAVSRRRVRPLIVASAGALAVFGVFAGFGFSWLDGLAATRERYFAGVASVRPYSTFLVANLGILAIMLGPAVAVGLARLRDRAAWLLVGGALAAVAIADVSGMSKSEVERIWLPFAPWILVSGMALTASVRSTRRWLALQLVAALTIEVVVRTAW